MKQVEEEFRRFLEGSYSAKIAEQELAVGDLVWVFVPQPGYQVRHKAIILEICDPPAELHDLLGSERHASLRLIDTDEYYIEGVARLQRVEPDEEAPSTTSQEPDSEPASEYFSAASEISE